MKAVRTSGGVVAVAATFDENQTALRFSYRSAVPKTFPAFPIFAVDQ